MRDNRISFLRLERSLAVKMEIKGSRQLYNKLFYIYTAVLACVVLLLVLYFYTSTRQRFLEQNLNYMEMMSRAASSYLEETADTAEYIHEDLYKSVMELNDALHYMTDEPSDYQRYRMDTYMENKISEYKGIEKFFLDAFQAYADLNYVVLYSYERDEITEYTRDGKSYRKSAGEAFKNRFFEENLSDEESFTYLKEIRNPATMKVKGCMVLGFAGDKFREIYEYYDRPELIVYNEAGTGIFASSSKEPLSAIREAERAGGLESLLDAYAEHIQMGQYHAVSYLERKQAARVPGTIVFMIFAVGVFAMAFGEALVRYYLQRLATRLNRILDGMTGVMDGDLDIRIPANKNGDELDLISRYFNEMCARLDEHIKKRYLAEIEQKNAEMAALQSQINPHFLYNTLNTIKSLIELDMPETAGKAVASMSSFYRNLLSRGQFIIPLKDELLLTEQYLYIQNLRFMEFVDYEIICDKSCPDWNIKVPKLTLQPIVENVFVHALAHTKCHIRLQIQCAQDSIIISVEDNGKGIPPDKLSSLEKSISQSITSQKSIGLPSVHHRITLLYGKNYGLSVKSREGIGTAVIIKLPKGGDGIENTGNY